MMIMKKFLSTVLLGLGITTATFAQFDLGIKGGVNTSAIITDAGSLKDNIEASYNTRTGFVGGVYARFGKKFYLQPEVVLASKGGEIIVDNTAFQVKYNDIDVPLLLGFKPLKFLHVVGGPVASLKADSDIIKPQRLLPGDKVGLITPGSYVPDAGYEKAVKEIETNLTAPIHLIHLLLPLPLTAQTQMEYKIPE